ncbi:MAG: NAD-dependent epimerase/dehydratase family protein [Candidatus Pelagadaptatus aseana]|uniref:NAD-dependent epimerase/dehydratase family protein n=1 Tax=Candidatus Pelagadaptatus aseana TaxID=3120508 RepID=UPI0039B140D3
MKILITGASGFIGRKVYDRLTKNHEHEVVSCVRRKNSNSPVSSLEIGTINSKTNWTDALKDCDVVIHLAARAHILEQNEDNPIELFRESNTKATINLANQAAQAGVKRFIFISSIGVNGSSNKTPFKETDCPEPSEPYAISKWEAEQGLWGIQGNTDLEIVIIRPPLVYGSNAPGNFGKMVRWIESGIPLPLGAINNKRSLISVDNLTDIILRCVTLKEAANQLFLVSDGHNISTTELLRAIAKAKKVPSRLVPIPPIALKIAAKLIGKQEIAKKIIDSLQVDPTKSKDLLGFRSRKKTTDLIKEII